MFVIRRSTDKKLLSTEMRWTNDLAQAKRVTRHQVDDFMNRHSLEELFGYNVEFVEVREPEPTKITSEPITIPRDKPETHEAEW